MAKKQKRTQQELESLIPTIKNAEKQLADQLVGARAEAEQMVRQAEETAAARVEQARADLPALLDAERTARLESLRREAEETLHATRAETDSLERVAQGRLAEAVAYIVSRVWPGTGGKTDPRSTR